jgi:uncharacterized membrane protein
MMDWNGHMTTGGWIISILWMAVVIAVMTAAIVWLARGRHDPRDRAEGSAREILDRRLARSELTSEEYARLRDTLDGRSGAAEPPSSRAVGAASG